MRDYLPDTVFDSLRTWAEVDLCALERNFDKVRARQPENVGVCAVIKADAYGHGSVEVAKALEGKAALFAVAMTDEGVQLRQNGIDTPILVLGHTAPGDLPDLAKYNVATTVSTLEEAKLITEFCRRTGDEVAVHAAVDTGMTRLGFSPDDEGIDACAELFRMKGVRVEGLFTHYASSDSADKTAAYRQEELFLRFAEGLRNRGIVLPVLHACNSAAAIGMKTTPARRPIERKPRSLSSAPGIVRATAAEAPSTATIVSRETASSALPPDTPQNRPNTSLTRIAEMPSVSPAPPQITVISSVPSTTPAHKGGMCESAKA